jgi:hypothetical protein
MECHVARCITIDPDHAQTQENQLFANPLATGVCGAQKDLPHKLVRQVFLCGQSLNRRRRRERGAGDAWISAAAGTSPSEIHPRRARIGALRGRKPDKSDRPAPV